MPGLQYWFTGSALAAFIALLTAVFTVGYTWYLAATAEMASTLGKVESAAQKMKTEQVKGLLGKALTSGERLIVEKPDKDVDQFKKDAEAWGPRRVT